VLFLWFIRWGAHAWAHGSSPFVTHHMNFPAGVNLMWNTAVSLASLAVAPVTARWGATVAYNLLATAAVALSTWCAYLMISRYVTRRWAALAGALVYGFSPFMLAEGAGHLHLMLAFSPPLLFLVLDELLVRQRHRPEVTAAALGLLVAAQVLISEEVAASEVLVAVLALVVLAGLFPAQVAPRAGRALRALVGTAIVAGALLAWPLSVQFFGPQRVNTAQLQPVDTYVSDALGFVVPTSVQQLAPRSWRSAVSDRFTGNGSEWTAYLGVPLLAALATVAVRQWRRPLVKVVTILTVTVAVLSLGPHLHVRGHVTGVPLPWDAVQSVPLVREVLPNRLVLYVDLFAGLLFALFLDTVVAAGGRRARVGGALLASAVFVSLFPRLPYPSSTRPVPAFFTHQGRRLPAGSVALVAPFVVPPFEVDAMLWQVQTGMRYRMPGGYFIGPDRSGRPVFGPLPTTTAAVLTQIQRGGGPVEVSDGLRRTVLADLAHWRVTTVIVGPMPNADATVRFFERVLGRAPSEEGQVSWWPDVSRAS